MTIKINHRSEIVLDGTATGYILIGTMERPCRVVKCNTNRDLSLPRQSYSSADGQADFERDFRAAIGHP